MSGDHEPELTPAEIREVEAFEASLLGGRPVPRAAFRGELRRRVVMIRLRRRARLQVAAYLASGVCLLAAAGLGVSGLGPLAPHPLQRSSGEAAAVPTR